MVLVGIRTHIKNFSETAVRKIHCAFGIYDTSFFVLQLKMHLWLNLKFVLLVRWRIFYLGIILIHFVPDHTQLCFMVELMRILWCIKNLSLNWVDFAPLLFALEHFMSTKTDSINHVNPSEMYYIKLLFGFFCRMFYSIKSFIFTSGTYVTKSINNPSIYNGRPQCAQ